mgnify:CR=1 FL=1
MEGENQGVSISGISTEKIQKREEASDYIKVNVMKGKKVDIRLGRGLANQIKINKTIPVSHKPKEERRIMFICGDDIASLIKLFENESK